MVFGFVRVGVFAAVGVLPATAVAIRVVRIVGVVGGLAPVEVEIVLVPVEVEIVVLVPVKVVLFVLVKVEVVVLAEVSVAEVIIVVLPHHYGLAPCSLSLAFFVYLRVGN